VADCRYRFIPFEEMPGELQRLRVGAKLIRVHQTARNQQRIEFRRSRFIQRNIDIELVAFIGVMLKSEIIRPVTYEVRPRKTPGARWPFVAIFARSADGRTRTGTGLLWPNGF
jgi:hypothetical protein